MTKIYTTNIRNKNTMDGTVIMKVDVQISAETEDTIFQGAEKILKEVRPKWHPSNITYKMLTDGITNKLVKCKAYGGDDLDEAILIRIYGEKTDLLIDRDDEIRNILMLNKFDIAPKLYATFANGLAYEYVPGRTLGSETVRQPEIYQLVARLMAKLHKLPIRRDAPHLNGSCATKTAQNEGFLWRTLNKFVELLPNKFANDRIHKKFLQLNMTKVQIAVEIKTLKPLLQRLHSPIVFCHNDLLLGNIIYTSKAGTDDDKVTFIDFEYADFNYQAYDIGNHFAEFAGIDNVDYNHYPSKELQYDWLKEYANEFDSTLDLDRLYVQVNQFALASHLLWGIWALIQAEHSHIDFDYIEYSSLRFTEYFRRKNDFLSLTAPNCN